VNLCETLIDHCVYTVNFTTSVILQFLMEEILLFTTALHFLH